MLLNTYGVYTIFRDRKTGDHDAGWRGEGGMHQKNEGHAFLSARLIVILCGLILCVLRRVNQIPRC